MVRSQIVSNVSETRNKRKKALRYRTMYLIALNYVRSLYKNSRKRPVLCTCPVLKSMTISRIYGREEAIHFLGCGFCAFSRQIFKFRFSHKSFVRRKFRMFHFGFKSSPISRISRRRILRSKEKLFLFFTRGASLITRRLKLGG